MYSPTHDLPHPFIAPASPVERSRIGSSAKTPNVVLVMFIPKHLSPPTYIRAVVPLPDGDS